jgi:ABC-type transport system involved in cytochrome c biogenesis permease subunit
MSTLDDGEVIQATAGLKLFSDIGPAVLVSQLLLMLSAIAVKRRYGHMKRSNISELRMMALSFMLPGLAGLIVSSMISITYLDVMPRLPDPATMRIIPRMIHGVTVYQTRGEDQKLDLLEYSSITLFLIGLGLGLVYLKRWGDVCALGGEADNLNYREH